MQQFTIYPQVHMNIFFPVKYEYKYSSVCTHEDTNIVQAEGVFPHILAYSVSYTLCSGRFRLESVVSVL
jgi:hypothetical protein